LYTLIHRAKARKIFDLKVVKNAHDIRILGNEAVHRKGLKKGLPKFQGANYINQKKAEDVIENTQIVLTVLESH
jgi:hypothetical protein